MKKVIVTSIVVVGTLGIIGYVLNNNKKKNEEKTAVVAQKNATVLVKTDTVQIERLEDNFVSNGVFAPSQELNFAAEGPGRVTQVLVKEGSNVKIGQTLAVIKVDRINVDIQTAEVAYQTAKADAQRFENAFKTGGVTKQQLDQMKLNVVNAKSRLDQLKISMNDAHIKATINGTVNKKFIEPGSVVAANTPLFEIVNVSTLKLKATVTEQQVANLKVGDNIQIKASVLPQDMFSGKVSFIASKADNTLSFPIEIQIANTANQKLKAGMYGTAVFKNTGNTTSQMVVDRNAFVGSVSANEIFVVKKDGSVVLRKVVSGKTIGEKVEILSGLQVGDIVVTSGQINLINGTKVTIIK